MDEIIPLQNTLALVSGETPASFISRLAAMNRATSAREFCNDFYLSFDKIARGDETELEKLARFASANLNELTTFAPQFVASDIFRLGHENISRTIATRRTMRICPLCARYDIRSQPNIFPDAAVAQRAIWLVGSVRTCREHACSLITISKKARSDISYDFAFRSSEALENIEHLFEQCFEREFSPFERYVTQRIHGEQRAAVPLLDPLDITSVDLISSWLGRFKLAGSDAGRRGVSDHEMYLAAQVGFDIVSNGPEAIRDLIQTSHEQADFSNCLRLSDDRLLGRTYKFFDTEGGSRPQLEEIRRIMAEKLSELYPPAAGSSRILGVQIERKLHSLKSAEAVFGLAQKTIKHYAVKAGIALTFKKNGKDVCYAIDVLGAEKLFGPDPVMDAGTVERQTGLKRAHLESLHEAGVISPIGGEFKKDHTAFFRRNDVEKLANDLKNRVKPWNEKSVRMVPIGEAALRTSWSVGSILEHVLSGKIAAVSMNGNGLYPTLRVSIDHLRAIAPMSADTGITLREAAKMLRISEAVLVKLVRIGVVQSRDDRRLETGRWRRSYSIASLAVFQENYISHWDICRKRGVCGRQAAQLIESTGALPEFDPTSIGCRIYRRSAVQELLVD